MKKYFFALLLAGFLALPLAKTSYAHGYTYWTSTSKIGVSHFVYSETSGSSDSGMQYSLNQRFNYHNHNFLAVVKVSTGYISAKYNYPGISGNVHYKNWSVLGGAGIDYRTMNGSMQNQLYLSLSEDNINWMTANSSFTNGALGYDEQYNTKYVGLNYKNIYAITHNISLVFSANVKHGIGGTVLLSHFPLYNGGSNATIGMVLGGEWGYGTAIGVRYRINNNLSLVGDLAYSTYFLKHSNTVRFLNSTGNYTMIYEPNSHTVITGLEFGVHYDF